MKARPGKNSTDKKMDGKGLFHRDFPFSRVFRTLEKAASQWQTPALEMVAEQQNDPFQVLIGTLLSLRTRDSTTLEALRRLSRLADTPEKLSRLKTEQIAEAIYPVAFFRVKAAQLRELAGLIMTRHGGAIPAQMEDLLALPGVGRKTANLTLSLGFGKPAVCVDVHVHRILNRLGTLTSKNPEQTEWLIRENVDRKKWSAINRVLVPFGQTLCTPQSPWCGRCPVQSQCGKKGVTRTRGE